MSNKTLTFTVTIPLPEDPFSSAKAIADAQPLIDVITNWLKTAGLEGSVAHVFVTKRAPKATPAVVTQAAE